MKISNQDFEPRQYMIAQDYEFFHYRNEPDIEIDYHNHDFYEIFFFISGKVTYMIEGRSYRLRPGDILLISNKELHKPVIERGQTYERMVLWVNPDFLKRQSCESTNLASCFDDLSGNKQNLLRSDPETLSNIRSIFYKLSKVYAAEGYGIPILRNIYLTELIIFINKAYFDGNMQETETDIQYNEKVSSIMEYINNNLGDHLSLDMLSEKFYLSKYHLLREFKKHAGYTIHQYIRQKRLIQAKMLLREGYPVTEIYSVCGFGDYSNFIRSFRKAFGMSPKQYYKMHL